MPVHSTYECKELWMSDSFKWSCV